MSATNLLELARPHYAKGQIKLLRQAIKLAEAKHAGQTRASGEPFVSHPLSVAELLIEWRLDIDSVIAGVLHDAVEDTDLTLKDIESQFNADVAFLVDGVTQVSQARSGMKELSSYLPQTSDNLSKLLVAISHDVRVLMIKLADRLHNLRTLQYKPKPRQTKIAEESLKVFAPMADRLGMSRVRGEIEEIAFSFLQPKTHKELLHLIKKRVGRSHKDLLAIEHATARELTRQKIDFTITGRVKTAYSLYKKLRKRDIDQIYDFLALRIVVADQETCYRTLGILHALYQPMLTKIKDYIAVPKPNGYQSLHTTVITPSKQIVEFQVRTKDMQEYAEHGLAATFHYNEQKFSKGYTSRQRVEELPRSLKWILELQETAQKLQDGEIPADGLNVDLFSDRIFIYSPKGDIYDLPEGSSVLDFAYAVHSDIGHHAHAAEVNNRIAKLTSPLHNGDIVKITTRHTPSVKKDWLKFVKTTKAKNKIKTALNKN